MNYDINSLQHSNRRILIIDPDPQSREILGEPLCWEGYDVRSVGTESEALLLVESWVPHVVILEWITPAMTGLSILKHIRQKLKTVSCVFVSENSSTEAIIEALDAGADDYIVKPFVPLELLARIRTQIRIRDLHEQLLYANEKLKELVDIDDLTGLYNMRSLYQRLDFELERARRFHRDVSVIMMDMDYFKTVNDGHDHLFGSYVLSEVGKIIRSVTRNVDLPARYGGDEFLVVLTETDQEGAMLFCERLRERISQTLFQSGEDSIRLTASMGIATTIPGEAVTGRQLVRRADHALYDSKRAGRNKVSLHKPDEAAVMDIKSAHNVKKRKAAG